MRKTIIQHCNLLAFSACLALGACGGGGDATPPNATVATPAAVANVLNVQLGALNNYAAPALPA
jgi:hypothetical protein